MSKSSKQEKEFVKRINKLINFQEVDEQYRKAGLSGKVIKTGEKSFLKKGEFETGARKKYFFDMIIFTHNGNAPDHFSFASTYYLDNPGLFKTFSSKDEGAAFITSKSKLKRKGKPRYIYFLIML